MENSNSEISLIDICRLLWAKRRPIIKWGIIGAVAGVVIALSIPNEYTSEVKVAPEGKKTTLAGSAGALASLMGLNTPNMEGVNYMLYPDVIYSSPFLMEFSNLPVEFEGESMTLMEYLSEKQSAPWWSYIFGLPSKLISLFKGGNDIEPTFESSPLLQQRFVAAVAGMVSVNLDDDTGILTIKTTSQDPAVAKNVADSLLSKLQIYMNNYRTASARATLESNVVMFEEAKQQYYEADEEYALAIDRNQNLISRSASIGISRLKNERDLAYQIYQQLALQVETSKVKLQEEQTIVTVIQPALLPVKTSAPNKKLIVIGFIFLFGFVSVVTIILKDMFTKESAKE